MLPRCSDAAVGKHYRKLHKSAAELHAKNFYGGNGEIRTHGGLLALDGFQDRSIKPLCHISRIGYQFI